MQGATVSVQYMRAIARGVAALGGSHAAFVERVGISAEVLVDADARLAAVHARRAWELVEEITGDSLFGLHLAMDAMLGSDELDRTVRGARSLEHGLHHAARYFCMLDSSCRMRIDPIEGGVRCSIANGPRHASECLLGTLIAQSRACAGTAIEPNAVYFAHERPKPHRELEQFFGCRIEWAAGETAIDLDDLVLRSRRRQ